MIEFLKAAASVILWIGAHRDQIKDLILGAQTLLGDLPGSERAAAVREAIAAAMVAEGKLQAEIDKVWPFVGPYFDRFVAKVKADAPTTAA